jgi:hypothetical protein
MWRSGYEDCFWDEDEVDPHLVRLRPVDDGEAEIIEAICQAATPGPLVLDDLSSGDGTLVATLPDGRNIVTTRRVASCPEDARIMSAASAQLICEARCLLLRLLHDRERWKRREESLTERVHQLEAMLDRQYEAEDAQWFDDAPAPSQPR